MENNIDNRTVRICPYCKQEYKIKIGIDNWKNLFRKPTVDDWISLVILLLLFAAAYAYITETKQCKETMANLDTVCLEYQNNILNLTHTETNVNLIVPNFTIGGEKDEHGCVIAAGYSWCESLQKCIRSWEENCTELETIMSDNLNASYE